MPPGKKPSPLKVIQGTTRPDREPGSFVDLPLVDSVPAAPDWMPNGHAIKEWDRLASILLANKLLTEASLGPLAHMCALHGKVLQLYQAGEAPTASMIGTLRNLFNDFGLTPVAQGKVRSTDGGQSKGNPFASNGKRSADAL